MKRKAQKDLNSWINNSKRKPLVIRGARQTGKSTLVRNFAAQLNIPFYEFNLEKLTYLKPVFDSLDCQRILKELGATLGKDLSVINEGLIFIDEIQAIPSALNSLRYFYEQRPGLSVIAAGSLLDLMMNENQNSIPVGRIEFYYLGPMTFDEFIEAKNIPQIEDVKNIPLALHQKYIEAFYDFLFTGGMPEAIQEYLDTKDWVKVEIIQENILETYRSDLGKYRKKIPQSRLENVFEFAAREPLQKVKYSKISNEDQARDLKLAINWLAQIRVLYKVHHTSPKKIPLSAGINEKAYKFLFLDVGLVARSLRLSRSDLLHRSQIHSAVLGMLSEQFVGQHLLCKSGTKIKPELFYWLREGKSNNAEIDFLIQSGVQIIPIEVKAGKTGSQRSLMEYCKEVNPAFAVRFDLNPYSEFICSFGQPEDSKQVNIKSYPIYGVGVISEHLHE